MVSKFGSPPTAPSTNPTEDHDDLILSGELSREDSTTGGDYCSSESDSRDEVQEVRKVARRDTFNVVVWRCIATAVLLLTAVAVTLTTYYFLERQQRDSFETQFEQFSRTVANAALDQQRKSILGYRSLADSITSIAQDQGAEWPYFRLNRFEWYAKNFLKQTDNEVVTMLHYVEPDKRDDWVAWANQTYEGMVHQAHMLRHGTTEERLNPVGYHPYISEVTAQGFLPDQERDYYFVLFDFSPAPSTYGLINWNLGADPIYGPLMDNLLEMRDETLITAVKPYSGAAGTAFTAEEHAEMHQHVHVEDPSAENPHSFVLAPLYKELEDPESPIVCILGGTFAWDVFMVGLLPEGVNGIAVVLENNCNQIYTYEIDGPSVTFLGEGDHHETKYNSMVTYQDLTEGLHTNPLYYELNDHCRFNLRIYPTSRFEDSLDPFVPETFAIVVASTFVLVTVVFYVYDLFVQRRNEKLVASAAQSNAIVSSLFPSNIRDRLINTGDSLTASKRPGNNLKSFMTGKGDSGDGNDSKPLADLFLECSVLFADIAGFTAWSSVREPSQVFTILETIYGAFDHIAKHRRVFKVETVGDCYVAAGGIPDYRKDHVVMMVRFARDILAKMNVLTKELETKLGPDTGDLSLRIGIHTGPVTAGVLRGERARFQLFGDTVNVCSRIEGTGVAGRIHLSSEAAESLKDNGKGHWLVRREEMVEAKGKGEIQTYWIGVGVELDRQREGSVADSSTCGPSIQQHPNAVFEPMDHEETDAGHEAKRVRLVDWNVEMLGHIMKQIVARRDAQQERSSTGELKPHTTCPKMKEGDFTPLEEVEEIIELPEFDAKVARRQEDHEKVVLPEQVVEQLRSYVSTISDMYRDNAFHNFDHASHVTMSVIKLLSRIIAPTEFFDDSFVDERQNSVHASLHDHTYGITSDPLTQFSCAFAAMIHDVDHVGVPNAQLVKEGVRIAQVYNNRSVAEQNSLVLAWDLLMSDDYDQLRATLCSNEAELERFRQLVVNAVMATDIVDKDLKALRNGRWDKAFKDTEEVESERKAVNRKATIVIEHLIQASDVAHTMQHWHVYRKWNEKFFRECYAAYLSGRAEKDPSEGWYKGEMGFFDFYIIPLAKKLKDCGVFGKSSDEYLTYALANRSEWEKRGEGVVAEMIEIVEREEAAKVGA